MDETSLRDTFAPKSRHLARLAIKVDGVRFSTKIQTENVFFGKTNLRGLLRQNWAEFSSGTILPLNAPYSQLGLEKMYEAGFIKKFQTKTCFLGWTKLRSGTLLPQNRAIEPVWPWKLVRCDLVQKFKPNTCFLEKRIREGFWGKIEHSFRPEQFCPRTHHIGK